MIPKDTLWKGIIEDLVEDFIQFFFPEIVDQIDYEKGFVFLDKELDKLVPQSSASNRHADKLIQVHFKNQEEHWFLIHVEVQGYADEQFAARMYQYAYRIKDRYQKPLSALAIYTNENRKYHITEYRESFLKTVLIYRFQTFVLIDHTPEELRQSRNLFGLVLEVALQELIHKKRNDSQRLSIKTDLVRHLFKHGVAKQKIRKLLAFIQFYIRFDGEDFFHKFEKEIQLLTKSSKAMGIEEAILHAVEEKGYAKGREAGEEQGFVKGEEQGVAKAMRTIVIRASQKGMTLDEIANLTSLSLEEITNILNDIAAGEQSTDEEE